MYDVICVGGSVAGSATAAFLAQRGRRVLILEKAAFPRDKACGEGLLPHGVAVLRRLGVDLPFATVIRGIRYRLGDETVAVPFQTDHGLAARRSLLDARLFEHARRHGAETRRGIVRQVSEGKVVTDDETFTARLLVGADGANSIFHRAFGLRTRRAKRRVGVSLHLSGFQAERDMVEVVLFPGGEAYIAPVDSNLTLVSLLMESWPGPAGEFLRTLFPDRMRDATVEGAILASAPLARKVSPIAGPGWVLVGDSAGCIDPITGEGMSVALGCAEIAADVIDATLDGKDTLQSYARRVKAFRSPIERLTNLVLFTARHPWLARQILRQPRILKRLMQAAVNSAR